MNYNLNTSRKTTLNLDSSPTLIGHLNKLNSFGQIVLKQINDGVYNILTRNWDVVLDIGANVGLFSYFISDSAKKIHAIEPTIEHYNVLTQGIEDLQLKNINSHNLAIGTYTGEGVFYLNPLNSTMNTLLTKHKEISYKQKINVVSLLDFIKNINEPVDLIKMDIEGAELDIIPHESFENACKHINNVYVEVHDFDNNGLLLSSNTDKIQDKLKQYGFKTTRVMLDGIFAEK